MEYLLTDKKVVEAKIQTWEKGAADMIDKIEVKDQNEAGLVKNLSAYTENFLSQLNASSELTVLEKRFTAVMISITLDRTVANVDHFSEIQKVISEVEFRCTVWQKIKRVSKCTVLSAAAAAACAGVALLSNPATVLVVPAAVIACAKATIDAVLCWDTPCEEF